MIIDFMQIDKSYKVRSLIVDTLKVDNVDHTFDNVDFFRI